MIGLSYFFYGWVGLALLPAAARHDAHRLRRRDLGRRPPAPTGAGASPWGSRASALLGLLGWFKYYGFVSVNVDNVCPCRRAGPRRPPAAGRRCPSPSRSSRSWRSATSSTSTGASSSRPGPSTSRVYLSFFPHLLAGPIVRGGRAAAPDPPPARPRRRRLLAGLLADHGRAVQEGRDLLVRVECDRGTGLHVPVPALRARGDLRRLGLRGADLLRLQRLHRHRHRPGPAARLPLPRRTSTRPTRPATCRTSGAAGTSRSRAGCATTSTSRSGATAGSQGQTVRNIMITMVLGGLWHGAAWTFVVWGALHGVGQSFGHLRRASRGPARAAGGGRGPGAGLGAALLDLPVRVPGLGVLQRHGHVQRLRGARPHRHRLGAGLPAGHPAARA